MDFVLVSNSPGEIAGWVKPVVLELARRFPAEDGHRVWICLPPCQFASGREAQVAAGFPGVTGVLTPAQTVAFALLGRRPKGFTPGSRGVVVHLGGDHWYSRAIAQKLGYKALLYTDRIAPSEAGFEMFAAENDRVRDRLVLRGVDVKKIRVIGSLMVDAVRPSVSREEARKALGIQQDSICVAVLPGSRRSEVLHAAPFFLRVVELMSKIQPDLRFVMPLSPFVPMEFLAAVARHGSRIRGLAGSSGKIVRGDSGFASLVTEAGAEVTLVKAGDFGDGHQYNVMVAADVAICLPGTNTAELGFLGIPHVVVLPTNRPEAIPLTGAAGIVGQVPLLGAYLKRRLIPKILDNMKFLGIPNKRARRKLTPEVVGVLKPEDVAIAASSLVTAKSERERISRELREVMGEPGAASRLVDMMLEVAGAQGA